MITTIQEYKKTDSAFDESKFCSKLSNIFRRLKTNASDGRLEEMQPYLSESYYNMIADLAAKYADKGLVLYTERITVLGVTVDLVEAGEEYDKIIAGVRFRTVEYVADLKTHKFVSGENTESFRNATVILKRQAGLKTAVQSGMTVQNCPYCGATVNINKSAKCEYCDRILNTDSFYWLIDSVIETVE